MSTRLPRLLDKIQAAKNIHVVGISGTEGSAIATFLEQKKINFTAHDFAEKKAFKQNFNSAHFGIPAAKRSSILRKINGLEKINFGKKYLAGIEKADLIFVSQNFEHYPPNKKLVGIYKKNPKIFATITQLYFDLFPGKILAITGTNGKSTVSRLTNEVLQLSRQKTWWTGNDRRNIQILDCLDKWTPKDWLVIEVSNRQLKFELPRAPDIGVITNVTANHLDEYKNGFSDYKKGKFGLIKNQNSRQVSVLNFDNPTTRQFAKKTSGQVLFFSTKKDVSRGVSVDKNWLVWKEKNKSTRVISTEKICLLGDHNLSNAAAAIAATRAAEADWQSIREGLKKFRGIPQRLEIVHQKNGVKFIDDSASTSPDSTIAAIEAFEKGSVNLIVGGAPKGMTYEKLARGIKKNRVKTTVVESPAGNLIEKELRKIGGEWESANSLETAVKKIAAEAKRGECVLLSPAAAWFIWHVETGRGDGKGFAEFAKNYS